MFSVCKKPVGCNFILYFQDCAAPPDKTLMNEMVEMEESSEEEKNPLKIGLWRFKKGV